MRRKRLIFKSKIGQMPVKIVAEIVAAALAIAVVTLALLGVINLDIFGKAFGTILTPIQSAVSSAVQKAENRLDRWAYQKELEKEYLQLKAQYMEQQTDLLRLQELEDEVKRLTSLLGYQEKVTNFETIHARVIATDASNSFAAFTINKGSKQGVKENDTVITPDGLVGRVYEVSSNHSVVVSIVDSRSSVGGIVERTRDVGIVHGNLNMDLTNDKMRMLYLPNTAELSPGDRIVTSGLEKIFPKGLLIGTVDALSRDGNYVSLVPAVDFDHLEEVLVIINFDLGFEDND